MRFDIVYECGQTWADLDGSGQSRSCAQCSTQVTNLSAMTAQEAEAWLATGDGACVRFLKDDHDAPIFQPAPRNVSPRSRAAVLAIALAACEPAPAPEQPIVYQPRDEPRTPAEIVEPPPPVKTASRELMGKIAIRRDPSVQVPRPTLRPKKLSVSAPGNHNETVKLDPALPSGTIEVGDERSPFRVTLRYILTEEGASVTIDSTPWAIVKQDGVSLGKTPRPWLAVNGRTRIEFVSPLADAPMAIVLRVDTK